MTPARFPPQTPGCPWPTAAWPGGPPDDDVDRVVLASLIDEALAQPPELGLTLSLAVVHRGRLVAEAFGPGSSPDTTLISWSMAKSITHAAVGLLVADDRLDLDAPAPIDEWADDDRRQITTRHLLGMASGLRFVEDYVDTGVSDVIEMLFGAGADDHAGYAAAKPSDHPPGTVWNYASGTTNIIARILGEIVGDGAVGMERFLHDRLFAPIGMSTASPKFDRAGTFVGSSYVYASARDFARFGFLYLRDGMWDDDRILPAGWSDYARTPVTPAVPADEPHGYGAHWWLWNRGSSTFSANGYEGQRTIVSPERDVVVVRLGKSPAELRPAYDAWLDAVLGCFPVIGEGGER